MAGAPHPLAVMLAKIASMTYYELLGVPRDAGSGDIRRRFHRIAARWHPDGFSAQPPVVRKAAAEIFKRMVEAYDVLSRDELRARYDRALGRGEVRLDILRKSSAPPPAIRTLETVARTPKAKEFARAADKLLGEGKLKEAGMQLGLAITYDRDNDELFERLKILKETIAIMG